MFKMMKIFIMMRLFFKFQNKYFSLKDLQETKDIKHNNTKKIEKRPAYHFASGAVYDGEWLHHEREGQGKQTWPDGASYEGKWEKNHA